MNEELVNIFRLKIVIQLRLMLRARISISNFESRRSQTLAAASAVKLPSFAIPLVARCYCSAASNQRVTNATNKGKGTSENISLGVLLRGSKSQEFSDKGLKTCGHTACSISLRYCTGGGP